MREQTMSILKKRSHNHNNNQTNPKKQPNTKNKPEKTIISELVPGKIPTTTTK